MARKKEAVDARLTGAGKAVLYGRYSSHAQKDASIEQQFRECRQYAERKGLEIIGEYADHALSGQTDQRPEFQRMIRDSKRGRFQYVITWKVDRFARNRYDSATYKARLKASGVSVLYAKEDIPEGPEGILLESVLEGSAEYYSANLSQNIRRGMEDNARACKANGSRVYGYRVGPDGRFEADPDTAPIVRRIFQQYDAGVTQAEIARGLNEMGLRTIRGYAFDKNSLGRIMQNEKYIGVYKFGDIRIEGGMPEIIDRELFDSVQLKLSRNRRAPAHRWDVADYLLTGKLYCGKCGALMVGRAGTGKSGRKYNYYACANRTRKKSCDKQPVPQAWIEDAVIAWTVENVLTPEGIARIADSVVAYQQKQRATSIVATLESKLAEVEKGLKNLMTAIEAGIITPTTKDRMFDLEAQKADLVSQIEYEKIERPIIPREELIEALTAIASGDPEDSAFRRRIVEIFVAAVYVFDDKLAITYSFSGSGAKAELPLIQSEVEGLDDLEAFDPSGESSPIDASGPPNADKTNTVRIFMIPEGFGFILPLPAAYCRK